MTEKERLRELLYCAERDYDDYTEECHESGISPMESFDEFAADYLISKGAVVPPCKVGDTVYYLNTQYHIELYRNTIYEAKVARIVVTSLGVALVIHIRDDSGCCEVPDIRDFGKTVFLTREEAEKALRKE